MRASMLTAVVSTCLVVACSGSGGTTTTNSGNGTPITLTNNGCSLTLSGSYTFTYTQVSGNCPMIPAVHETIPGMAMPSAQSLSAACPNGSGMDVATPSAAGCNVSGNFSGCQLPNTSDTFDITESVDWNASYTSASGTFSISITGAGACSGSYDVTVTQP